MKKEEKKSILKFLFLPVLLLLIILDFLFMPFLFYQAQKLVLTLDRPVFLVSGTYSLRSSWVIVFFLLFGIAGLKSLFSGRLAGVMLKKKKTIPDILLSLIIISGILFCLYLPAAVFFNYSAFYQDKIAAGSGWNFSRKVYSYSDAEKVSAHYSGGLYTRGLFYELIMNDGRKINLTPLLTDPAVILFAEKRLSANIVHEMKESDFGKFLNNIGDENQKEYFRKLFHYR